MSLGQVALGLAGIALGLQQIKKGAQRIHAAGRVGPQRGLSGGGRVFGGTGFSGGALSDVTIQTAAGPVRMRTYPIRNLDERIVRLRKLVEDGKRDPAVYIFARQAVNKRCGNTWCTPEKNSLAEAKALFQAIRKAVRYTSDIRNIDSYQRPGKTLQLRTGDCDDYSTLTCASASSIGLPCRLKVIRTRGAPEWNHIYAEIGFPRQRPTKWVPFDASVPMPFGWEAPKQYVEAVRVFPT